MNIKTRMDWKFELGKIFDKYPDLKAPQYQSQLITLLNDRAPSLSSIQKELIRLRKEWELSHAEGGLDTPWHLGLSEKHHIPAEALPSIFMVQNWSENYPDEFKQPHNPLTIRQVIWISRIYALVGIPAKFKGKDTQKIRNSLGHYLYIWADAYATRERIQGAGFDSTGLDRGLRQYGEPMTAEKSTIIFYRDNSFEIDTIDDKLLSQMEAQNKDGVK